MILAGTTAVVTGGAVRIGRELSLQLAQHGVNVCLHYGRSREAALSVVGKLRELGVKASSVSADLSRPVEAARAVFQHATAEHGSIQILINCAAIFEAGTLLSTDVENWNRHLSINLQSPFFLTQEFVRQLPEDQTGAVVNIVDWRAERPVPGHVAYTISKAGLLAQTKLLAQELGPRIRVNAIAPGAILPPPGESDEAFQKRAAKNPLLTTGSPNEIARAMLYLLQAPFVTGDTLHVTGGEDL